jgi:hypothetical protein
MPDAASFAAQEAQGFAVLPENWDAVMLFLKCCTQWRHAGLAGIRTGLDYSAVDVVMRHTDIKDPQDAFWRLQQIESEALAALAEKQD